MDFKKVLILVLLISSTWALDPGKDENNPENNDELHSSDESDDGMNSKIYVITYNL